MIVFWPSDVIVISGLTLIAYTFIGARLEERKLIRTFGKSYTDYMKEVPSIFPNLKDFGIAEYFRKKNNSIS
jgi:protein-S-isoprenylcysteine O-methyltransferase Ste14